jgi:hypothetical protein
MTLEACGGGRGVVLLRGFADGTITGDRQVSGRRRPDASRLLVGGARRCLCVQCSVSWIRAFILVP